jgi:hypothetical protein
MSNKRFLITEEERKSIKKLYNLVSEQLTADAGKVEMKPITKQVNFEDGFNSGYYSASQINPTKLQKLNSDLKDTLDFINQHAGKDFSISIFAGEDNSPNTDREAGTNASLPVLELARRRASTMKKILTDFFQNAVKEGKISQMPRFEEPILQQGTSTTPAERAKDRYVRFQFNLVGNDFDCLNNMKIMLNYDKTVPGWGKHTCDNAIYEIKINGIPLVRTDGKPYASLNNAGLHSEFEPPIGLQMSDGKRGGARYNSFIINKELAEKLLASGSQDFAIEVTCRNIADIGAKEPSKSDQMFGGDGLGCHRDIATMKFKNGLKNSVPQVISASPPEKRGETKVFARINACGYKVG